MRLATSKAKPFLQNRYPTKACRHKMTISTLNGSNIYSLQAKGKAKKKQATYS